MRRLDTAEYGNLPSCLHISRSHIASSARWSDGLLELRDLGIPRCRVPRAAAGSRPGRGAGNRAARPPAAVAAPPRGRPRRGRRRVFDVQTACWAANKRFEISKFKFKFPRARTYELNRARSRLYRSQILQVNTRWKALAEIYTMHSFAPIWNPQSRTG